MPSQKATTNLALCFVKSVITEDAWNWSEALREENVIVYCLLYYKTSSPSVRGKDTWKECVDFMEWCLPPGLKTQEGVLVREEDKKKKKKRNRVRRRRMRKRKKKKKNRRRHCNRERNPWWCCRVMMEEEGWRLEVVVVMMMDEVEI